MALTEEQKMARMAKRRLNEALKAERRAHHHEAQRRRWVDEGMYLKSEEAEDGEPCRGCGLPVIDRLGNWPGTSYMSDDERIDYDATQARFSELHPDCDSHRWSMAGSRATHCGSCCPPLPIPEQHLENLCRFLDSLPPRLVDDLVVWRRTLTCGHMVEVSVHHSHSGPSMSTELCPECDLTRGVISSEKVTTAASPAAEAGRQHAEKVAQAEHEVAKAEKAARAAKRKLDALRAHP